MIIKLKIIKITLLTLLSYSALSHSGAITDGIASTCPQQFSQYKETVREYAIRMKSNINKYGCEIISAYGVFIENNPDKIELWEDEPENFENVVLIFEFAQDYGLNIKKNPEYFYVINRLISLSEDNFIEKIKNILSKITQRDREKINQDPKNLIYWLWVINAQENQSIDEVARQTDKLMSEIPSTLIIAASILNIQIHEAYPDFSQRRRLELINELMDDYSTEFLLSVSNSPMALSNVIYLLRPQLGDIPELQNLSDNEVNKLREDYIDVMIDTIKQFKESFNDDTGLAMEGISLLVPYIVDALREVEAHEISSYLTAQINSPVFTEFLRQNNECSREGFAHNVAIFFSFLAPKDKENEPIKYLEHNLIRISKWYVSDENFKMWIDHTNNEPSLFISNMSKLPYYYYDLSNFSNKKRKYISQLLTGLPSNINNNASFIIALYKTNYFDWIESSNNADIIIYSELDENDTNEPIYKYILTTPFPKRSDKSVFERFKKTNKGYSIDANAISLLTSLTKAELKKHLFDSGEKFEYYVDTADDVLMVVSILATPLTGGLSIGYSAARMAAKKGIKAGFKYASKSIARNTVRSMSRLTGQQGQKLLKREAKELWMGTAKRGRPSHYSATQKVLNKSLSGVNNISNKYQINKVIDQISIMISSYIFENSDDLENDEPRLNVCQIINRE